MSNSSISLLFPDTSSEPKGERARFVGFYWTFGNTRHQTPYKGHEQALELSHTVAAQRLIVARASEMRRGTVVAHVAAQDPTTRPTGQILTRFKVALARAEETDARVLCVDFHSRLGWRPHYALQEAVELAGDRAEMITLTAEHQIIEHFRLHRDWASGVGTRRAEGARRIGYDAFCRIAAAQFDSPHIASCSGPKDLASRFRSRGFLTYTGARWSEATARRLVADLISRGLIDRAPWHRDSSHNP